MAVFAGSRIRTNNVFGTVTDNPLAAGAVTMNSAGLANLAVVTGNHAVLVLDPLRSAGAPEIVIVTAHTGAATSATVTRGAYGTTARSHASGVLWVLATTIDDLIRIVTSGTQPTDVYEGQLIYETDTDTYRGHNGTAWEHGLTLGAWTSYTPTLSQGATSNIAKTVTYARYVKTGRVVIVEGLLAVTGPGTASAAVNVTLPLTAATAAVFVPVPGHAYITDASAGPATYPGFPYLSSTTVLGFSPAFVQIGSGWNGLGLGGGVTAVNFGAALASGDTVAFSAVYEAAS